MMLLWMANLSKGMEWNRKCQQMTDFKNESFIKKYKKTQGQYHSKSNVNDMANPSWTLTASKDLVLRCSRPGILTRLMLSNLRSFWTQKPQRHSLCEMNPGFHAIIGVALRIMRMEDTLTDLWGILQDQEPSISPSNCVEVMHNEGWGILPGYYKYHLKLKILESQENSQTALTCLSTTAGRKERLQCGHGCKSSLKLLRMVGSLRPNHSFFKRTISKKIQVHFIRLINWVSMSFILYT